jgi:hypothetical protein
MSVMPTIRKLLDAKRLPIPYRTEGKNKTLRGLLSKSRIIPLGVPNPERRRPHGSFPRGQNPIASICATPPLLTM